MATATERRSTQGLVPEKGPAGSLKALISTVELGPSASGTTIDFGNIPSNARISGLSKIYADDLSTTGSPTLDLGLAAVNGNVTSDPDALTDGLAISSALAASAVVKDIANVGRAAWEFVGGVGTLTADPGGQLQVYGTVKDAATAGLTATITCEIYYYCE